MEKLKKILTAFLSMAIASYYSDLSLVSLTFAEENENIFINEICAKNTTLPDENGNYFDWIELYNNSDKVVDLSGYGLSEKEKKPFKYIIPDGTTIQPKSYLVIYCDKDYSANDPSIASFSLSTDGETVLLTTPDSTLADKVKYENIKSDISYGRIPDGSAIFSLLEMSPGKANDENDIIVNTPEFSHEGGFYDDEFELELSADTNCKIYYTLDGSDPTPDNGILYDSSINIYDKTIDDNFLCNRTDISAYEEYIIPTEKIDKATVIKAVCVNDDTGKQSDIAVNTYFVDYQNKADYYKNWKIISIVTDSNNLFGDENGDGIYILGKTYNDWINSNKFTPDLLKQFWPANYRNEGREYEREAVFQIIENNKIQLSQNVGIRIHGGATRSSNQKSFNIYARSEYGKKKIEYNFFNDGKQKYDSLILRNGGNDRRGGRFRDKLNQQLVSNRNFLTQQMEPCIVFINGEYWGHYEITEKISSDYIKKYTGIEENNLFLMKNNEMLEGNENDLKEFNDLVSWIRGTDFSENINYEKLNNEVDIQNYIDYICSNIYFCNTDWITNNVAWFKEKNGKYQFIMFDAENDDVPQSNINLFKMFYNKNSFISYIYKSGLKNENFRKQFCTTFMDISNNNFDKNTVFQKIDEISVEYEKAVLDTFKRFFINYSNSETYSNYINQMKNFYNERFDNVTLQLKNELNLNGELVNVTIENNENNGTLTLNTITPKMNENNNWNGKYFTDYPISLSAVPNEGHKFSYFELSNGERIFNSSVEIELTDDILIKAIYDTPYLEPSIFEATYGDKLESIDLPTDWAWSESIETIIGNTGTNTFTAYYIDDETITAEVTIEAAPKELTPSIIGTTSKEYDGTTDAVGLSIELSGIVGDDEVFASAEFSYNSADVKTADMITASSIVLSGTAKDNYTVSETVSTAGTITKSTHISPDSPTVKTKTNTSVTLDPIENAEYSIDGENWQNSTIFSGLVHNNEYILYARIKETDNKKASDSSFVKITTEKTDISEASVTVNGSYVYDGKKKIPEITVKLGDDVLTEDTDYTLSYSGNLVDCGTVSVIVNAVGNYKGTAEGEFVIAHNITAIPQKNPTCTEKGYEAYWKCDCCNAMYSDAEGKISIKTPKYINALGHIEVIDEAIAPTCTDKGRTKGSHCSVCDKILVKQETVKATGHTEVIDEAVAPTCADKGRTEGSHCSVCNEIIKASEEINATGHSFEKISAKPATVESEGNKEYYICKECKKIFANADGKKEIALADTVISKLPPETAATTTTEETTSPETTISEETTTTTEETTLPETETSEETTTTTEETTLPETTTSEESTTSEETTTTEETTLPESATSEESTTTTEETTLPETTSSEESTTTTEETTLPETTSSEESTTTTEETTSPETTSSEESTTTTEETTLPETTSSEESTTTTEETTLPESTVSEETTTVETTLPESTTSEETTTTEETTLPESATSEESTTTTEETTLPQTGNNNTNPLAVACSSFMMMLAGAFTILKSGIIRRKENDDE